MSSSQLPFTSASFPNATIDVPFPKNSTVTIPNYATNTPITIITSDGVTRTVFDTVATALLCLNYMRSRKQYYLQASDEITIINCETKLLIVENTFLNQKLMNSFVFCYFNGAVTGIHRNLSTLMSLTESLVSVGYKKTSSTPFNTNAELETNLTDSERPRIKVVDYFYNYAGDANNPAGSLLQNTDQIILAKFEDGDINTN